MRKSITIEYETLDSENRETCIVKLACGVKGYAWTEGEALQQAIASISAVDNHKLIEMARRF